MVSRGEPTSSSNTRLSQARLQKERIAVPVDGEPSRSGLRLVPAPGHTCGTQVVVVETAGGRSSSAATWRSGSASSTSLTTEGQRLWGALDPELVWLAHVHEPCADPAPEEVELARPTGVGCGITTYSIPIEGRDGVARDGEAPGAPLLGGARRQQTSGEECAGGASTHRRHTNCKTSWRSGLDDHRVDDRVQLCAIRG